VVTCCVRLDDNFRVDEEIVRRDHRFLEDDALDALFRYARVVYRGLVCIKL